MGGRGGRPKLEFDKYANFVHLRPTLVRVLGVHSRDELFDGDGGRREDVPLPRNDFLFFAANTLFFRIEREGEANYVWERRRGVSKKKS